MQDYDSVTTELMTTCQALMFDYPLVAEHKRIIGEIATSLGRVTALIGQADQYAEPAARREWLHDLRTPLNVMLGYAQLLTLLTTDNELRCRMEDLQGRTMMLSRSIDAIYDVPNAMKV
jgi:signal transduction histidine kinase